MTSLKTYLASSLSGYIGFAMVIIAAGLAVIPAHSHILDSTMTVLGTLKMWLGKSPVKS